MFLIKLSAMRSQEHSRYKIRTKINIFTVSCPARKKRGEPWTYGIRPRDLPALLRDCNLELLEDVASIDYRRRYMYSEGRHLDGYEFYRVALAEAG